MINKGSSKLKGVEYLSYDKVTHYKAHLKILESIAKHYKYKEHLPPMIAPTSLFQKTISNSTIVQKEMFLVNDGKVVLRPEATAIVASYLAETGELRHKLPLRIWYYGPMFRHENPQKGRSRQFYQFGLESFYLSPTFQALEILTICWKVFQAFNLSSQVILEINNLGSVEERNFYISILEQYIKSCNLSETEQHTLTTNPLRWLDRQDEKYLKMINQAPLISDYVHQEQFNVLIERLKLLGIPFRVNPRMVRGLDYYTHEVFEWKVTNNSLGSQNAICSGGRYDDILKPLGLDSVPAIGCAFGMERIILASNLEVKEEEFRCSSYLFANKENDLFDAFLYFEREANCFFNELIRSESYHIKKAQKMKINEIRMIHDGTCYQWQASEARWNRLHD